MSRKRDPKTIKGALRMPAAFLQRQLTPRPEPPVQETVTISRWQKIARPGRVFPDRPLTRNLWLFVWILFVVFAAQLTLFLNPLVGVYVNAAALLSIMWLALRHERARQLLIAVAIIPISMLVGLSLPFATEFQRVMTISTIVLLLGLTYQYLFTLDFPVEGTKARISRFGYLQLLPLMIVGGMLIGLIAYALMRSQYEFQGTSVVLVVLGVIIMAISEEILFRGLIQQRAMIVFHPVMGSILAAALYTLLTIGHGGGLAAPVIGALIGLATGYAYYKKQNLLLTIAINASAKLTFVWLVVAYVLH